MIIFETPTELDLIALRTFGISAKETESPIGRFGTGLKYALAVLLREGQRVSIQAGRMRIEVEAETRDFRGQDFAFVIAKPAYEPAFDLGFTSLLGRDWELWQAYRELHSNTVDEGGRTYRTDKLPALADGRTAINIAGSEFEAVYDARNEVLIEGAPLWEDDNVAIHEGPSDFMFYRGIRARKLERPAAHRYNIKCPLDLTEDRTIKYAFLADRYVAEALAACNKPELVATAIGGGRESLEGRYDYLETSPKEGFAAAVATLRAKDELLVPASAALAIAKPAKSDGISALAATTIAPEHKALLDRVGETLRGFGIDVQSKPLVAIGMLEGGAVSIAKRGRIYLAEAAFVSNEALLRALVSGHADLSGIWNTEKWLVERIVEGAIAAMGDDQR